MAKSHWFCITMLHYWFKKFPPLFPPIKSKTKTNRDSLAQVFPRFAAATVHAFCLTFDWFTGLSVYVVIGSNDYLGFGFTTPVENRSNYLNGREITSLSRFLGPQLESIGVRMEEIIITIL